MRNKLRTLRLLDRLQVVVVMVNDPNANAGAVCEAEDALDVGRGQLNSSAAHADDFGINGQSRYTPIDRRA